MSTAGGVAAVTIRAATPADAVAIARIYNHYVTESVVTFEEEPVAADEVEGRIAAAAAASFPWLVAELDATVVGFAYASAWKGRCAYKYSAEVTVYVEATRPRLGIGSGLYAQLIPQLRERGLHTLLAGIALPNDASVALHEKFGFRNVAHLAEVGFKLGGWVDVGYWQLIL